MQRTWWQIVATPYTGFKILPLWLSTAFPIFRAMGNFPGLPQNRANCWLPTFTAMQLYRYLSHFFLSSRWAPPFRHIPLTHAISTRVRKTPSTTLQPFLFIKPTDNHDTFGCFYNHSVHAPWGVINANIRCQLSDPHKDVPEWPGACLKEVY